MKYHFASFEIGKDAIDNIKELNPKYLLGSYYYLKKLSQLDIEKYFSYVKSEKCEHFILDSGAFTYINGSKKQKNEIFKNVDFYINDYANFVKKWECKNYIELDLDDIFGYKEVKKIRAKLEEKVGWKSMPVFHNLTRNKLDLDELLQNYNYICISNFNFKKDKSIFKNIKAIVKYAKSKNVKVHGLALTGNAITKYIPEFYSIDSSSWTGYKRFGSISFWCSEKNEMIQNKNTSNFKIDYIKTFFYVIKQWKKYQTYLDK